MSSTASSDVAPTRPAGPLGRWAGWTRPALVANLVAQMGLVVTGGAVRLTGSGLGCSTWPQCEPGSFTPMLREATSIHPFIEFGNRTLTGVLGVIAIVVALLVFTDRRRSRGFRVLGLVPLVGVALQAVIGGLTVLLELHPAVVGVHLLISMALIAASAILLYRHDQGVDHPGATAASPALVTLGHALTVVAAVVLALGVVVTGAGPHGGDDEVAYRFTVDPVLIAKLHAGAVWAFLAVLVALIVVLARRGPDGEVGARRRRAALVLLAVTLAQGAVGYAQYLTGLPEVLVGIHMLGAALLTASVAWTVMTLRRP
ncbi:heme A synthase [Cellulomonas fimi]|uniref:Heme A synthase n=2 Tax=Cellulomonas fimi TaxID=1708 RepID=A0A7Y0M0L5_CELFI|nr:heme A synthase [Cellulomonas fimi]